MQNDSILVFFRIRIFYRAMHPKIGFTPKAFILQSFTLFLFAPFKKYQTKYLLLFYLIVLKTVKESKHLNFARRLPFSARLNGHKKAHFQEDSLVGKLQFWSSVALCLVMLGATSTISWLMLPIFKANCKINYILVHQEAFEKSIIVALFSFIFVYYTYCFVAKALYIFGWSQQ